MKKLHDRVYDTPGTCPVCGAAVSDCGENRFFDEKRFLELRGEGE